MMGTRDIVELELPDLQEKMAGPSAILVALCAWLAWPFARTLPAGGLALRREAPELPCTKEEHHE